MVTRITGAAMRPNGGAYASATFTFLRSPSAVVSQDGSVIAPVGMTVTTDAGGLVDFDILPGTYEGQEAATGRRFAFVVPDAPTASFGACVDAPAVAAWPDAVTQAMGARDEAVAAAAEAVAASGGGTEVQALVTSVAEGLAATTPGQAFAVATGTQTDLYRNEAGAAIAGRTDIEAFADVIPVAPPTGAALVASAAGRKVASVSLRKIMGSAYVAANNGAGILNAAIPSLAAAGLTIVDPDGLTVRLNSTLYVVDDLSMDFGPQTWFLRGTNSAFASFGNLPGANLSGARRVRLSGINIRPVDETFGGHMMVLTLFDSVIERPRIVDYGRTPPTLQSPEGESGHGLRLAGERIRVTDPYIQWRETVTGPLAWGTAGIRIVWGKDIIVQGGYVSSGDDALQFVPVLDDVDHPAFHLGCENCWYIGVNVRARAKAIIASMGSSISTDAGSTAVIRRCGFIGISGYFETNAFLITNDAGTPSIRDQVSDITLRDINLQYTGPQKVGDDTASVIVGSWDGAVGDVIMEGVHVDCGTMGPEVALTVGGGARVTGEGNHLTGRVRGIRVTGAAEIDIGGIIEGATEGLEGDIANRHLIGLEGSGAKLRLRTGSKLRGVSSPMIAGVSTPMAGINIQAVSELDLGDLTVEARPGSSGTKAIRGFNSGARIAYDRLTTDCPVVFEGTAEFSRNPDGFRAKGSAVIAGGIIAGFEGLAVTVDTEALAATDDLDTITPPTGLRVGEIVTLQTLNAARDVTVKHGTGNIQTTSGQDLVLTTPTSRISLVWDGAVFRQIGASQAGGGSASLLPVGVFSIIDSTNKSISVTSLAERVLIAGNLTRSPTYALQTTGAVVGDRITFVNEQNTTFVITITLGGVPAVALSRRGETAELTYDGTGWVLSQRYLIAANDRAGLVPPLPNDASQFLNGLNQWAAPPSGGGGGGASAWVDITGKPNTLAGYGITDAMTATDIASALSGKSDTGHSHSFASLTDRPTDLAGYAISDAVSLAGAQVITGDKSFRGLVTLQDATDPTKLVRFQLPAGLPTATTRLVTLPNRNGVLATIDPFTASVAGMAPASGGGTTNFLRADGTWAAPPAGGSGVTDGDKGDIIVSGGGATWSLDYPSINATVAPAWGNVTGTPTTLSGYGITDGITAAAVAADYQPLATNLSEIAGIAFAQGDLVTRTATVMTRIPKGLAGQVLTMNASATAPEWATAAAGGGIEVRTSDPASPADGLLWYRSDIGQLRARSAGETLAIDRQIDGAFLIPASGQVVSTSNSGAPPTPTAGAADRMDIFQWRCPRDIAISAAIVRVSSAVASAQGKIVVYAADANGRPDTLIFESGAIDFGTTGNKSAAWAATLQQGRTYWIGIRHSGTASVLTWPVTSAPSINGGIAGVLGRSILRRSMAFGNPAPSVWGWDDAEISNNNPAAIWWEIA